MARINYTTTPSGVALYWERIEPTTGTSWPAVLVIHGGGFKSGRPQTAIVQQCADAGFLALGVEYRLAPPGNEMRVDHGHEAPGQDTVGDDGRYPKQTYDIGKAIQIARADPKCDGRVFCIGGSAGGSHTAFMLASGTAGDNQPDLGVIMSCGVSNLGDPNLLALATVPGETSPHGACTNYVGIVPDPWPTYSGGDLATLTAASPVTYMTGILPPVWVMISSIDSLGIYTSTGVAGQSDLGPPETDVENGLVPKLQAIGMTESLAEIPETGKYKLTVVPVTTHQHAMNYWDSPFDGNGPPTVGAKILAWLASSPISPPPPPPPEIIPIGYHLTLTGGNYSVLDPIPMEYTNVLIQDLDPDTEYTARLVAYNAFGESPPAYYSFRSDPAVGGVAKDQPRGNMTILPQPEEGYWGDTSGYEFWTKAYIDGTRARSGWFAFQPTSGDLYDWDQLDALMDVATTNSKVVGLSIGGGIRTPQWVYDAGAIPFNVNEPNVAIMPMPWDPVYQQKFGAFVHALGDRYDSHPNLAYVLISGVQQNIEFALVDGVDYSLALARAISAGYPDLFTAWRAGADIMTAFWFAAFPTTPVVASVARLFPTGTDENATLYSYVDDKSVQYASRIGFMGTTLNSTSNPDSLQNGIVFDHSPEHPAGFQFLRAADGNAEFDASMQAGLALRMKYVEIYKHNYESTDPADITTMEDTQAAMLLIP